MRPKTPSYMAPSYCVKSGAVWHDLTWDVAAYSFLFRFAHAHQRVPQPSIKPTILPPQFLLVRLVPSYQKIPLIDPCSLSNSMA
jgi:hypothetical protein